VAVTNFIIQQNLPPVAVNFHQLPQVPVLELIETDCILKNACLPRKNDQYLPFFEAKQRFYPPPVGGSWKNHRDRPIHALPPLCLAIGGGNDCGWAGVPVMP